MSTLFSGFTGNLRAQKPNKSQTKRANIMGVQYFWVYQQVLSTSYFLIYPLSICFLAIYTGFPYFPLPPPLPECSIVMAWPKWEYKHGYRVAPNLLQGSCLWQDSPLTTALMDTHMLMRLLPPLMKTSLPSDLGYSSLLPSYIMTANQGISNGAYVNLF